MGKQKKVSIIIVNYNSFHLLKDCLRSIKKNTLAADMYEVIVIDNHSQEDEAAKIRKEFPWVTLIINKTNEGFARANNRGIKISNGEYVLLLNPDTIVPQSVLDTMVTTLDKHKDAGAATCRVVLPDSRLDDACHRGFPTPWNAFCFFSGMSAVLPFSKTFNGYHLGFKNMNTLHEIDSCAGAFMLVRRVAGEAVGWLDEDYFWYGEDIDLCYKLKEKNWKILFDPQCEIIHFKGVSSGIKDHSRALSKADKNVRIRSTDARFAVMKIFYRKHYKSKYPNFLQLFVFFAIDVKKFLTSI